MRAMSTKKIAKKKRPFARFMLVAHIISRFCKKEGKDEYIIIVPVPLV